MPFPAKNCNTGSAECAGAFSWWRIKRAISPQLSSLSPHGINKDFQHLHAECLINSGPFGYKFKVVAILHVEKVAQHYFHLGL
jgi:hypothetical protein